MITIELKKHENVVHAPEFKRKYDSSETELAIDEIEQALEDYEVNWLESIGTSIDELEDYEKEEIENLKKLVPDVYQLDCGDYTYWIKVESDNRWNRND